MDSDTVIPENGHEAVHQNGAQDESILNTAEKVSDIAFLNGSLESVKLDNHGIDITSSHDASRIPQEGKESTKLTSKSSKHPKNEGNKKNEKTLNAKVMATSMSKESKDGKDLEAVASRSSFDPKQPAKSRSFKDRQPRSHLSKQDGKYGAASSETSGEQMKPKPLNKGPPSNEEGDTQPTENPSAEDAKPRRVSALPNYGFSFRCDDRAEKRKEFYSKLEEKIHAREMEKNNQQTKSKETQEAEIKLLRKSLTFKATPMPNFYQEPAPTKPELKKIPPTKATSPKLGRRKSSAGEESKQSSGRILQPGRLSLDTVGHNNNAKAQSSANPRKPIRKSLPKLPSEKTSLSAASAKTTDPSKTVAKEETTSNIAVAEENCASSDETSALTSPSQGQEQFQEAKPSETQPDANVLQQAIAVEHYEAQPFK